MTYFQKVLKMVEQNKIALVFVFLLLAFGFYSMRKNIARSTMTGGGGNGGNGNTNNGNSGDANWNAKPRKLWSEMSPDVINQAHDGATGISSQPPLAANPAGMNSGPANADGIQTVTAGLPPNCSRKTVSNPSDLLPNKNNDFGSLNQNGSGDLANINLLKAGYHVGIDTIGSTLRNSNLQLRSEPPNPNTKVSPWMNSTIEPDLMRVPLEIGCGPQ